MDRTSDWPWCWKEEIDWKADLQERDYDFLQELIDNAVEDIAIESSFDIVSPPEEMSDEAVSQKPLAEVCS